MSTSTNLKNLTTPSWRDGFADALAEAISRWQIKDKQAKFLMRE
jgi:N-acetylmuramoyl-L-alanine amidase